MNDSTSQAAHIPGVTDFQPPTVQSMQRALRVANAWFNPLFLGLDKLDLGKPALWVGNHTLYGLLDVPLLAEHLYREHGVFLRGLGDRGHFLVPGWSKLLVNAGMVLGTPENCAALMQTGQHVLVFPGGGREVMRRKGEDYQLIWKKRSGFARLAIEHGYDIIPFGSLGADENFDILLDARDISSSRLWKLLDGTLKLSERTRGGDMIPPIARGIGVSLVPRPQRFYFGFGKRISTARLHGKADDAKRVWALREKVARSIEEQLEMLTAYREQDRPQNWSALRRFLAPVRK
ncbi:lysophospholipid acyltransferase family protein [Pseudomonas sp. N040]|uniref:lysophospholipid acyltransferase family protein n=1 Tax=Pseudomonas sp. N040 TaxID=2785325 RepID=UPI0018A24F37|nr:lysophospholipid acyltransferase family protein [Pseudomonas sp. N040]MBF7730471.1 acyltransferase family protein [Pseudomonas sp. N040]MBW7014114.1 acyltransferase family protein [Pseudomonas sp. N040]